MDRLDSLSDTTEGDGFGGGGGSPLTSVPFPPWPGPGFCFSSWLGGQAKSCSLCWIWIGES